MLRLFHGSKNGLTGAIAPVSRLSCDFGRGFYMGESAQQPETLICRAQSPRLYELEFDPTGLAVLETGSDLLWALVVACNRGAMERYADTALYRKLKDLVAAADVIDGRIANDRVFMAVNDFFERRMTLETLSEVLKAVNLGGQYCARTVKACSRIRIVSERGLDRTACENLGRRSENQRTRAVELTNRLIDGRRHLDGIYFDELCEKYASGEGLPEC